MMSDIKKEMWKAITDSPFIMIGLNNAGGHKEPMTAQLDKDANSAFWIFTRKTNRIAVGGEAMAQYVSKGHDLFACMSGTLTPETDPAVIDRHWNKMVAAWYPEGRGDPSLHVLRFDLKDAEVWRSELGLIGAFKLLTGAKVNVDEIGEHEKIKL
jgi:general stress protein 26